MENLCDEHSLCPKCCGIQNSNAECFDYKLKKCKGICAGEESVEDYNARVSSALEISLGKLETHIIIGGGRNENEKSVVLIDAGEYKGFAFTAIETSLNTVEEVAAVIEPYQDNADVRKILRRYLNSVSVE